MYYCINKNKYYKYTNNCLYCTDGFVIKEEYLSEWAPINDTIMRFDKYSICFDKSNIYIVNGTTVNRFKHTELRFLNDGTPVTINNIYVNGIAAGITTPDKWSSSCGIEHLCILINNEQLSYHIIKTNITQNYYNGLKQRDEVKLTNYYSEIFNNRKKWAEIFNIIKKIIGYDSVLLIFNALKK